MNNSFDKREPSAEKLEEIAKIIDRFKNLECVQCANEIQKYAIENGISGTRIKLDTGVTEFIIDDSLPTNHDAISDNGKHEGVELSNSNGERVVFDNHHKTPVPTEQWIDNFYYPSRNLGNRFKIERTNF
ncbi:MAG: papain fold toxin domain-containing protein [Waterburya sp.]